MPTAPVIPPATRLADRISAVSSLTRESLLRLDRVELEQTLQELFAQLGGRSASEVAAGELHANGTLRIPSLVAVWLIGRVSEAYRPGTKLVKLSRVRDVDVLRSVGGVAELLIRSIRADIGGHRHE